jgi:uncharacterized protein
MPTARRPSTDGVARRLALFVLLVLSLVLPSSFARAANWTPPPLRGHVVDEGGALSREEAQSLDRKLERVRRRSGFAIVVFVLPSLPEGKSIEDVGYEAGNAWGVGAKGIDDGVLLIASLGDRKLRIETGRGVGGALTDLQSSHINREVIGPLLREGRTFEALDRGTDAIVNELTTNTPGGKSESSRGTSGKPASKSTTLGDVAKLGLGALVLFAILVLAIISPTFRELLFWLLFFGFGRGGRGGGGGGGGSGYGGGGGSFGGGGSSDDY